MKNKKQIERETPITDGDSRPDQNIDGEEKNISPLRSPADKKPVTRERAADVDSLEDYKDAKDA
ncbi:MAG TPA: hypothetical protein VGD65_19775 [Chryseosolibacter sp.]